jgi:3-isopropylmalate dehydrogenase
MNKKIAVIPGDGIGPEVTAQSIKVLNAIGERFGHVFSYEYALMGADAIDKTGSPLPDETVTTCLASDAVLFGAIGHPKYDNDPTAKVRPEQGLLKLRKDLQLFANIRPIDTYKALSHMSPLKAKQLEGIDFVIFRELTGGIYFGKKELAKDGQSASDLCSYTVAEIERIAHLAFKYAQNRRKKLTLVDKANVLETSRLWRKVVQGMSATYPDVTVDYMFVDNISDEASVLSGSLGLLPSASVGNQVALFEPIHGSYPQAAGKDIANPLGSILSAAMLLDHLQMQEEAVVVRKAVDWTLTNGFVSKDIDPINNYATTAIGEIISDFIEKKRDTEKNNNDGDNKSTII